MRYRTSIERSVSDRVATAQPVPLPLPKRYVINESSRWPPGGERTSFKTSLFPPARGKEAGRGGQGGRNTAT
jgi:hypothetical protein